MGPTRAFKFLLLLNFLTSAAALKTCPSKCKCVRNSVRCLEQGLTTLPLFSPETHTLDLRFNKITNVPPGFLSKARSLRSVLLNDNQITSLSSGAFHGLKKLKYLYLYRNRIQHIDHDTFTGLNHLEQLYLHVNEIFKIDPRTFTNLPRLERLYLQNNNLVNIPAGSFSGMPKLHKLRLDSNALVCDCSMKWFVEMINEHSDMNILATCYGPAQTTGTSLSSMKLDDFHCRHPEIKKEPKDTVVQFGDDAAFTCVASGDPVPEIVWFRDSVELAHSPSELSSATRYEIMNNGTLMVHDVDETAEGVFECMAKNANGEVRSKPAMMTVKKREVESSELAFVIQPTNKTVKVSEPFVSFDCVASGIPKPHISWLFNGEKLLLDERLSIKKNGTIIIKDVTTEDVGDYTCLAENVNGKIAAVASLQILIAPAFTVVPKDITPFRGSKVELTCKARGVPKPIISWYFNTMDIPIDDDFELKDDNQTLVISDVSQEEEGIYHCRAENPEGIIEISAMLKLRMITVRRPRIVLKPEDTDAYRGTSVQLPCEVESEPPAALEWSKDGSRIIENDRISVTLIGTLVMQNLALTDTGRYECSAYNEFGRDTARVYLTVKDHFVPGDEYVNIAITQAIRDIDQAIARTVQQLFKDQKGKEINIHDLYAMTRFPSAPERQVARGAEIYERAMEYIRGFLENGLPPNHGPFIYENALTLKHLDVISKLSGCVAHRQQKECWDICFHMRYRSIDGSCNNFDHPMWGASLTAFRRLLFPIYENGFSQPVGWNKDKTYNGYKLPGARAVSIEIISTKETTEDQEITHMVMQWGQWLDHDLDHALPSVSSQTWDGVDCKKTCEYAAPCFPIEVPVNDTRINNRRCIDFIRTSAVCGSGMTSVLFGNLQPREQINQLTSFIDASQVYGFERSVAEDLRDLSNSSGLLRVGATFPGKKPLLPTTGINAMDCRRNLEESSRSCFVAGDIRANEQIGLTAMHTIWMREHNRIATKIKSLNKHWDGNQVYQEARKVVGAEIQFITYEAWLPLILGPEGMEKLGKYTGYDRNLNPSISNVFATAALRFGHSMINPILHRYDENFETIPQGHLLLRNAFFAPWRLIDEGGVDPLIRGMFITPAKLKTSTQNLNSELTEKLFHSAHAVALDLAAINIQRGRDHAIPPYTKFRQLCNMTDVDTFDDLAKEIPDKTVRDKLEKLYGSVHNIDVWVGGILENQMDGAKVGPLFQCILVEQFKRLRDGDRLWYENTGVFKPEQLQEIKKTSLARILCDNGDNIDTIGENVFLLPEQQDGLISCDDIPSIDLRFWTECDTCYDRYMEYARADRRRDITNMEYIEVRVSDENDARFGKIQKSQKNLAGTLVSLKKRMDDLEKQCKTN